MTTKELLDSIYIIPAILDHIKQPTKETAYLLGTNGVSKNTLEEAKKIETLLRYHLKMIKTDFAPDYPSLRIGLKEYFDNYLSQIWQRLGIVDTDKKLLDYGAGAGQYSDQFLADNMAGEVVMIDKEDTRPDMLVVDFEQDTSWYDGMRVSFDIVLLAEVLHCKDEKIQNYLIQTSRLLLKNNGWLVIVENVDYAMAYRIGKLKGQPHPVLDEKQITALIDNEQGRFKRIDQQEIQQHKIYVYEKV